MLSLETTIRGGLPVIVQARFHEAEHDVGIREGYEFQVYFPNDLTEIPHTRIPELDLDRIVQELENERTGMSDLDL